MAPTLDRVLLWRGLLVLEVLFRNENQPPKDLLMLLFGRLRTEEDDSGIVKVCRRPPKEEVSIEIVRADENLDRNWDKGDVLSRSLTCCKKASTCSTVMDGSQ